MSNKLHWRKNWSAATLGDDKVHELTPQERGLISVVWDFLHSQTDTPGKFIVAGETWNQDQIVRRVSKYLNMKHTNIRYLSAWYARCIRIGLIVVDPHGIHYSPRIVKDHELAISKAIGGRAKNTPKCTASDTNNALHTGRNAPTEEEVEVEVEEMKTRTSQPHPEERISPKPSLEDDAPPSLYPPSRSHPSKDRIEFSRIGDHLPDLVANLSLERSPNVRPKS